MTNREAIRRILDHKRVHSLNEPRAVLINEALDLAIKALEERPQGKWVDGYCNKCGGSSLCDGWGRDVESRFCPHCGADMRGKEE